MHSFQTLALAALVASMAMAGCVGHAPSDAVTIEGGDMVESSTEFPPGTGWVAVMMDIATWCASGEDARIAFTVAGEGALTASPWASAAFVLVDQANETATHLGTVVSYGGFARWARAGVSVLGETQGHGVEKPLPPLHELPAGTAITGGPCPDSAGSRVEDQTGQRPDALLFLFSRHSSPSAVWSLDLNVPRDSARVAHGPIDDHVVYYQDDMPSTAGAYAGPIAAATGTDLEAKLGSRGSITTLVFMPGNDLGGEDELQVARTNASMTPPGQATVWFADQDRIAAASHWGEGTWRFMTDLKARIQFNDPVIFGANVDMSRFAPVPSSPERLET